MPSVELDGNYNISSTSNYNGPLERKSDGKTEIIGGKTSRYDANGVLWRSTFTIVGENEVEMISTADPGEAKSEFALINPDGSPTLEPVTYVSALKLARKGNHPDVQANRIRR